MKNILLILALISSSAFAEFGGSTPPQTSNAGAAGNVLVNQGPNAIPAWATPGANANFIINGGMDVNQLSTTGSFSASLGNVANTTDVYSIDRWKVAGDAQSTCQRTDASGGESGITSRYFETWQKTGTSGKLIVYQCIESFNVYPLASRTVTVQCKLKASLTSADKKFRLGLLARNSGATVDTLPSSITTAVGTVGVDPTWDGNTTAVTPTSVPTGANGTVNGKGIDCTLTVNMQLFAGTFSLPTAINMKNLMVAIWADDVMTVADVFSITEVGLYDGTSLHDWIPRPIQQELAMCQRCAYVPNLNATNILELPGVKVNATSIDCFILFPVPMRVAPGYSLTTSGFTNSAPTGTQCASFDIATGAYNSIVGAFSTALGTTANSSGARIRFTAATSFNGTTAGWQLVQFGPTAKLVFSADF